MRRFAAISGELAGSQRMWMGGDTVRPGEASADHHHGEADNGIYIVSGHPRLTFLVDGEARSIETAPGDFVYVPAWVPHREFAGVDYELQPGDRCSTTPSRGSAAASATSTTPATTRSSSRT